MKPASSPSALRKPRSPRRWAIRAIRSTTRAPPSNTSKSGAIGEVREVHVWTNRPLGFWPQGVPRPEPLRSSKSPPTPFAGTAATSTPVSPPLWPAITPFRRAHLGSLSRRRARIVDYHPIYHPFNWRGWSDWGVGAIGDMGAHLIDHSMWALDLGLPTSIETSLHTVQRRLLPARHADLLRIPRPRLHAAR